MILVRNIVPRASRNKVFLQTTATRAVGVLLVTAMFVLAEALVNVDGRTYIL